MQIVVSGGKRPAFPSKKGFTLLEISLAIIIVVAMLFVVLFFYRQVAQLRENLITETDRVSAVRLILSRLTLELRTARNHETLLTGLTGSSNRIEFVRTALPSPGSWARDDLGRALRPESDLKLVSYQLAGPGDPAEATGIVRSEAPVPEFDPLFPMEGLEGAEENDVLTGMGAPPQERLTEHLRYLRFRYWNGASWQDDWDQDDLPLGVEVTLGAEPFSPLAGEDNFQLEYPFELFRRIIHLPGSRLTQRKSSFLEMLSGEAAAEELP